MNTVAKYRNSKRRAVNLSTGDAIELRPLSVSDFLEVGEVPTGLIESEKAKGAKESADPSYYHKLLRAILLNCVVGPKDFRIVDKRPMDCADGEISLSEISPEDSTLILNTVVEISGLAKKAAEAARPFPSE